MDFTLLSKKPIFLRNDFLSAPLIMGLYYFFFGDQAFDLEHLLASICLILSGFLIAIIFLLNFWSTNAHVFLCYNTLKAGAIDKCSHVRIRLENRK